MKCRRQEEITAEREEIDRQKKMLLKKRPSNSETGRKRSNSQQQQQQQQQQQGQASAILHNGTDATFLKPDAIPGFSWQEYYEADEILKVSHFILTLQCKNWNKKNFPLFLSICITLLYFLFPYGFM